MIRFGEKNWFWMACKIEELLQHNDDAASSWYLPAAFGTYKWVESAFETVSKNKIIEQKSPVTWALSKKTTVASIWRISIQKQVMWPADWKKSCSILFCSSPGGESTSSRKTPILFGFSLVPVPNVEFKIQKLRQKLTDFEAKKCHRRIGVNKFSFE